MIVAFGIMEMALGGDGSDVNNLVNTGRIDTKKFGILKIFRIFRVFRIAKVLRKVKAMRNIINGINKSISNIMYTIGLLLLFIIIFLLLGMSLLKVIPDFGQFLNTFYIVFQALTVENYNGTIYYMYP